MNQYGDIDNATAGWYFRQLLSYAAPVVVLERFAATYRLPANQTKVAQWQRPVPFQPAMTPLAEGVTPSPTQMRYETVSVTIQQYGAYVPFTDHVEDFTKNRFVRDTARLQGDQIAATSEALRWAVVRNGTSVQYGGSVTARENIDNTAIYSVGLQDQMTTRLMSNKAGKMTQVVAASPDFGSYGIEAAYIGFVHTDFLPTLRSMSRFSGGASTEADRFLPVARYGSRRPLSQHEAGTFDDVRYLASPDLTPYRGGGKAGSTGGFKITDVSGTKKFDVYPVLVIGQEYFGTVTFRGPGKRDPQRSTYAMSIMPSAVNPRPRGGDPLGQRGWIGYKFYQANKVLQDLWGDRAEVALKIA